MRVAIVGSEEKYWTAETRRQAIKKMLDIILVDHWLPTLISGGCPKGGVDIWVEILATVYSYDINVYHPENNRWEPNGYKKRNMEIAETCDVLYCVDPADRDWSGGMWTMNYAQKLGKEVHHIRV